MVGSLEEQVHLTLVGPAGALLVGVEHASPCLPLAEVLVARVLALRAQLLASLLVSSWRPAWVEWAALCRAGHPLPAP